MSLSNIAKEPRREITESIVGVIVTALIATPLLYCDYRLSIWFEAITNDDKGHGGCPWLAGMVLLPLAAAIGAFAVVFVSMILATLTHEVGERVCQLLDDFGIRLRPRR